MEAAGEAVHLVWRRDTARSSRRWLHFALIGVAALCGFGAFAAYMADDPGSISTFAGLGIFLAVLLWSIPAINDWNKRRNPEIRTVGRELAWAKKRLPIDDVDRFAVFEDVSLVFTGSTHTRARVTIVKFRRFDGTTEAFTFADLPEHEREGLAAAMDRVLPGRRIDRF